MKILAVIPARKNSKRILNKNLKILGKKPLVQWTIDISKKIPCLSDILISTDSLKILNLARKNKILAPWLRPKKLSSDKATTASCIDHALKWYERKIKKVDAVLILQPTSPFRTKKLIYRAIKIFKSNKSLPVVGVSKIKKNSTIKNKIIFSYDKESKKYRRFKKSKNIFFVNGSVYLVSKMYFKENKHIYKNIISPVISNNIKESLDINTYRDFEKARSLID